MGATHRPCQHIVAFVPPMRQLQRMVAAAAALLSFSLTARLQQAPNISASQFPPARLSGSSGSTAARAGEGSVHSVGRT